MGYGLRAAAAAAAMVSFVSGARAGLVETFDTNPIGVRAAVEGTNSSRDTWLAPAAPWVFSTAGTLTQNLCSNWRYSGANVDVSQYMTDGARLSFPLGRVYRQGESFSFGATLRVLNDGIYAPGGMQLNFGLTGAGATGWDRTSSLATFGDTYDSIEWDYFPDSSPYPYGYPTAQQVVFGTRDGAGSAFARMAAQFGALLPTGTGRGYGLPHDTWLDVTVRYDAGTRTVTASVKDSVTGVPYVDQTTEPDLVLPATWGDGRPVEFAVDRFSIMNYQNYWASGPMPGLLATVEYDKVWFSEAQPVAEPGALLFVGLMGMLGKRRN